MLNSFQNHQNNKKRAQINFILSTVVTTASTLSWITSSALVFIYVFCVQSNLFYVFSEKDAGKTNISEAFFRLS